jgi:hypothetical protein
MTSIYRPAAKTPSNQSLKFESSVVFEDTPNNRPVPIQHRTPGKRGEKASNVCAFLREGAVLLCSGGDLGLFGGELASKLQYLAVAKDSNCRLVKNVLANLLSKVLWGCAMFKRTLVAMAFASAVFPSIAFADAASVARSCASGGDCVALVNAEIAGMTGSQADKDKAIADLVVAIGNEAQSVQPETRQVMANAVDAAALQVSDAGQRARIVEIAATLRRRLDTQTAALGGDAPGTGGPDGGDGGEKNEFAGSPN